MQPFLKAAHEVERWTKPLDAFRLPSILDGVTLPNVLDGLRLPTAFDGIKLPALVDGIRLPAIVDVIEPAMLSGVATALRNMAPVLGIDRMAMLGTVSQALHWDAGALAAVDIASHVDQITRSMMPDQTVRDLVAGASSAASVAASSWAIDRGLLAANLEASWFGPQISDVLAGLDLVGPDFTEWIQGILAAVEGTEKSTPPNLHPLLPLDRADLLELAEAGVPVWGAPRTEVVEELLAAKTPAERAGVLRGRLPEVLQDSYELLERAVRGDHAFRVNLMRQSIVVIQGGEAGLYPGIAGLLAATEAVLREALGSSTSALTKKTPEELDIDPLLVGPLRHFYRQTNAPAQKADTRLSRHLVTHDVPPEQITPENAAVAALMAASAAEYVTFWRDEVGSSLASA